MELVRANMGKRNDWPPERFKEYRERVGPQTMRKVKPIHKFVVGLHLAGWQNGAIATKVGFSVCRISNILNDPLIKKIIETANADADERLGRMLGKAVDVIDTKMDSGDERVSLKAAEMVMKANGKYGDTGGGADTAEDVIKRALEIMDRHGNVIKLTEERGKRVIPHREVTHGS